MNCYNCAHRNVCKHFDILDKITDDGSLFVEKRKEFLSEKIGYACFFYLLEE